jgi:DNA (cytosine-5)-methyltransferase 1
VNPKEPCRTIKAQPGKFTGPFHWKNRHFTIDELKRLQTFPDDYKIVGSPGIVLEQIGNSVPPKLARAIAVSVRQQLITQSSRLELRVRQPGFQSTFRQRQRLKNKQFNEIARRVIAASGEPLKRPLQLDLGFIP